jgi:hypothetical protein
MTAIKREQIIAAVATALAGTTGVSTRIYRSRAEAFARDEAPAIIIEPAADVPRGEPVSTCKIDWTLTIAVIVYTRGAIPDRADRRQPAQQADGRSHARRTGVGCLARPGAAPERASRSDRWLDNVQLHRPLSQQYHRPHCIG